MLVDLSHILEDQKRIRLDINHTPGVPTYILKGHSLTLWHRLDRTREEQSGTRGDLPHHMREVRHHHMLLAVLRKNRFNVRLRKRAPLLTVVPRK
jgi:hypothetical protein